MYVYLGRTSAYLSTSQVIKNYSYVHLDKYCAIVNSYVFFSCQLFVTTSFLVRHLLSV